MKVTVTALEEFGNWFLRDRRLQSGITFKGMVIYARMLQTVTGAVDWGARLQKENPNANLPHLPLHISAWCLFFSLIHALQGCCRLDSAISLHY